MPHNRTRLWVGLAIVAVTIPAVGTYYFGSTVDAPQGAPIAVVGRTSVAPLARMPGDEAVAIPVALLDDATGDHGVARADDPAPTDDFSELVASDDEVFDVAPLSEDSPRIAYEPAPPALDPVAPDAGSAQVAYATEEPADDEPVSPTLSDAQIYRLVVNNLPEGDRDEFVRAYAAMGNAQRVALLDGFRDQLEDNGQ